MQRKVLMFLYLRHDICDLDLAPEIQETINQYVAKFSVDNHSKAEEDCSRMTKSFLSFITICQDLVRVKLLTILYPAVKHYIAQKLQVPSRLPLENITKSLNTLRSTRKRQLSSILTL